MADDLGSRPASPLDPGEVLDALPDAVVVVDPGGTIRSAGGACERLLGYTPGELVGRSVEELVPEAIRASHTSYREAYARQARSRPMGQALDLHARRKDGGLAPVDIELAPHRGGDGALDAVVAVVRDASERRALAEILRQSQKMEALGRLAAGVAHDFNNVLTTIIGYAELIRESAGERDVLDWAAEVLLAAEHGAALSRQLLAFGRKQVLEPEPLDLGEVVHGLEPMLRRLLGEAVTLRVETAPGLPLVETDRGQLQQVVVNLAVNGRDAMPQGGTLTIEAAATPEGALLAVSDTGTGMDEETQARIFEPFFTTKALGEGTGLGLATVYGIVVQSGGRIEVESEPGKGSRFLVRLPRAERPAAEAAVQAESETTGHGKTVLVVEDEDVVRNLIVRHLRDRGYAVIEARNGREALDVAAATPGIDLILTDTVMPEMSGPELIARLAERGLGIRIVYMSGYTDSALARSGAFPESALFLPKPFTISDLGARVREALERD